MALPLTGIRVLDLTMGIAGPTCGMVLADLGAEVLKIESDIRHDLRRIGARHGTGAWTAALNRNKLAITINLAKPEGAELLKRLSTVSDVLLEAYTPRVMEHFGLTAAVLLRLNPTLIYLSHSCYGQSGPYRSYVGTDGDAFAMSGLAEMSGHPEGPPVRTSGAGDSMSGMNAAMAVLMALYYRRRTGRGQHLDSPMREALLPFVGPALIDHPRNGHLPTRLGNDDATGRCAPHGVYSCAGKDQWIAITVDNDAIWQSFAEVLGGHPLVHDQRFATSSERWANRRHLNQLVQQWSQHRPVSECISTLIKAGVPVAAVRTADAVLSDTHLKARDYYRYFTGYDGLYGPYHRLPWRSPGWEDVHARTPAPTFAMHNDYVFRELLGVSQSEAADLVAKGVIQYKLGGSV